MADIEEEVDSTLVFVQEATQLTRVSSLEGVLEKFGYSKDDRINRRELVIMYKKVEKDMENEIYRLANTSEYDKAKEMRSRLTTLRAEFDSLQTNGVVVKCKDQVANFIKARSELDHILSGKQSKQAEDVRLKCEEIRAEKEHFHNIEVENLEVVLSRVHRPPMKYSKRLIELLKAEHELIKLCQYEDARKVRRMIDRILPGEEKAFHDEFDAALQARRDKLQRRQDTERQQLEEKLKAISWNDVRARELEATIQRQRMDFHEVDMLHSHAAEKRLRPEMSVKPSALWAKRKGFETTAASLRGVQLLGSIRGKREDQKIFADTLVDKHQFFDSLQDTVTIHNRLGDTV